MLSSQVTERIEVLLVEDDKADVIIFKDLVESSSARYPEIIIGVCHTFSEAERALSERKYDVILLDLLLPDIIGFDGLERLCRTYPEIPIIIHSGHYNWDTARQAIRKGAADFIVKGVLTKDELIQRILHAREVHSVTIRLQRVNHA